MGKIRPAFENAELAQALHDKVQSWLGTNYAHMGVAKGHGPGKGGVDCTKLMGLIMVELGILKTVEKSYYGRDWFIYGDAEVVLMAFTEHLARHLADGYKYALLKYRPGLELYPGDVICMAMRERGLCNHTVMYLGKREMLHAIEGPGVHIAQYNDYWAAKARFVYRILRSD